MKVFSNLGARAKIKGGSGVNLNFEGILWENLGFAIGYLLGLNWDKELKGLMVFGGLDGTVRLCSLESLWVCCPT